MDKMRILLCGMGNEERGDDGFGSYIVKNIHETDIIKTINCHLYLENYLNKIVSFNPTMIILFDTVKNNDDKTIFLRNDEILAHSPISASTHSLPFSAIYQFLKKRGKPEIWFIGVRPNSYEHFSDETMKIAQRVTQVFNLLDRKKNLSMISLYENLSTILK